ncbi:transglutaminase-like domain-containing protein [Saccharibacillus sacchari]|uniref:Transglutaminase-like domain-containing protein n=1 Tax=Saccharibacillus sacchari TaxID=456493 RepID=A0ACC6P7R9_9BACL
MYKRTVQTALAFSLVMGWISTSVLSVANASTEAVSGIEVSSSHPGTVTIGYDIRFSPKRYKLMILKSDTVYTYNLDAAWVSETFPLQSGGGAYEITLLEQVSGTNYRKIDTASVKLTASEADQAFLSSVQNVNWQEARKATALATKLTSGKKTDRTKTQAIYDYVTANVVYEAEETPIAYLPSVDDTLTSGKGMCYDYASLMAVMLRSSGIPTKLVMGNTTYVTQYHAWNEVYLDGEWVIVDATVDATYRQAGKIIPFAKEASKYTVQKVY